MKRIVWILAAMVCTAAFAESILRIEVGDSKRKSSNDELQHRVYDLERAVWQLQQKVFNLENTASAPKADGWICTIDAAGDTFTGTGGSQAVAMAASIRSCKAANDGDGFFCKNPKCQQ